MRIDSCWNIHGPIRLPCLFARGVFEEIAGIVPAFSLKILDHFQDLDEGGLLFPEVIEHLVNAINLAHQVIEG